MLDLGFEPQIRKIVRQIRPGVLTLNFFVFTDKEVKLGLLLVSDKPGWKGLSDRG
jgi:hypothetical protein